ncbi:MAG: DEAD/DEAH box helicase [Thermaerobacter sp.]|nr:DEAD/DEAH box helicase [Thermaerobacter sp.]
MLRLFFRSGNGIQGFAFVDGVAVEKDKLLRFLSCAGDKKSLKALDRILRSADRKRLESTTLTVTEPGARNHLFAHATKCRTFLRAIDDSTMQLVAVAEECETGASLLAGDRPMDQALFLLLQRSLNVPLVPEWSADLLQEFKQMGKIKPWTAEGNVPAGAEIDTADGDRIVSTMLAAGRLAIPQGNDAPDIDVTQVSHMDSYMRHFGKALGEHLATTALHTPGTAIPPQTVRTLFPAQADAAEAMAKTWRNGERSVWMVGEQGVGKTIIGVAAAVQYIGDRSGRILVHCPGHLVPKWEREVRQTIPGNVRVVRVRDWHDALHAIPDLLEKPKGPEVWIMGRDSAKLSWNWKLAARRVGEHFECPSCSGVIVRRRQDDMTTVLGPDEMKTRGKVNAKCLHCGEPLWQADPSGPRRIAPSKLWSRRLPAGTFDVLLADEIHEEKGDSIQGHSIGRLVRLAKRTGMLTGTLIGGKASDMYWHLQRTQPRRMREYGFTGLMQFVRSYGVTEERHFTRNGKPRSTISERPGIHPAIYGDWLLGRAVFLELQDIETHLPPYEEEVHIVAMDEKQTEMVDHLNGALGQAVSAALKQKQHKAIGTYVQAALAYPDRVWSPEPIKYAGHETQPYGTYPDRLLPKETAIASLALREAAKGRRTVIFAEFTGTYDITHRLKETLEDQGLSVALLTKDVPGEEREAWIAAHKEDVLICHPRLVATGLDLLEFPTIIWAQTGWSLFTMRQASRRSWRIGQTRPVKVHFFAYEDTMQQTVLQVLAEKMLASQAIEGRFSAEGLQALAEGSNTTLRLAQALAFGLDDLPDLSEVWRRATDEIEEVEIAVETTQQPQVEEQGEEVPVPTDDFDWRSTIPMPHPDMLAIARASLRRRRYTPPEDQLALFG